MVLAAIIWGELTPEQLPLHSSVVNFRYVETALWGCWSQQTEYRMGSTNATYFEFADGAACAGRYLYFLRLTSITGSNPLDEYPRVPIESPMPVKKLPNQDKQEKAAYEVSPTLFTPFVGPQDETRQP